MSRRLAPLSVPYRIAERGSQIAFGLLVVLVSGGSMLDRTGFGPLLAVGLVGAFVLLLSAYETAYFRRFEYDLTEETLDIRSGVVARREREIPYQRVQNVDIRRNAIQRVLGIAAVSFETAGGSQTEATLRFVSFDEAKRLQREIGQRKRRVTAEEPGEQRAAELLFSLSPRELAIVGALSFDLRLPGAAFVLVSSSTPFLSTYVPDGFGTRVAVLGAIGLVVAVALISWLAGAAVAVLNYYDFRLSRTQDELQYERGLVRRFDGSIPLEKIQTLTVRDNPLKRLFGYATLFIETAGYAPGQGQARGSEAAVPLARQDRVFALANDIEPFGDVAFERPPRRVRRRYVARYLIVIGVVTAAALGLSVASGRAFPWYGPLVLVPAVPVAAHLKWRHRGYWLGPDHVVTRNGVLRRETKVVPYDRIQTVIDTRSPFQRRWHLATVTADTAGSLSLVNQDAAAVDVDEATADALRAELAERTRVAVARRREERLERRREALGVPAPDGRIDGERERRDESGSDGASRGASDGEAQTGEPDDETSPGPGSESG
jgi:putative membrane protein